MTDLIKKKKKKMLQKLKFLIAHRLEGFNTN